MLQEFEYIADLTRNYFQPEPQRLAPPAHLDWKRFLQLCFEHRITGTVLPYIERSGLDAEMANQLDVIEGQAGRETMVRLLFLEKVLATLATADCHPIVLKGGPLATDYYRRTEHRFLADLDLLVEPDEVETACHTLASLGLKLSSTRADPGYYRDHHFHWILSNDNGFVVEVHWGLTLPESIYSFDLEGLKHRSVDTVLNSTRMRAPSPEDLLLHIVGQCTGGGFGEMRRVIDAALLYPAIQDPQALVEQARNQNQGHALWALLTLVEDWTGVQVPSAVMDRLRPPTRTARLLHNLTGRVFFGRDHFLHRGEIQHLLHWLCAPSAELRRRELRKYLSPGKSYWLEVGYAEDAGPSLAVRLVNRISRMKAVAYLAGTAILTLLRSDPEEASQGI